MELRLLRYFLAVARENSFTRAAHYLHVTQPTLSRQMMDLEEELGQKLLNRETHHITLTPEGMLLRRRAEEIMALVQKTEAEFNAIGENVSGDVYIGGGESKAMDLVADAISELHEDYPGICWHLYTGVAGDVMERLDNGLLDFGVLLQPVDIASYDSIALPVKDAWGVLMRRDNPLAEKESVTPEDLRTQLSGGRIAVALMSAGHFTSGGHFILLRGVTLDGNILVADPNSRARSLQEWDASIIINELSSSKTAGAPLWFLSKETD